MSASSSDVKDFASQRQQHAANPVHSAWVDASAGSGKTKVLVDRVLNLLLAGVPPHRILCLTYTKAAAANMALRLNKVLGEWATLDDAKLAKQLNLTIDDPQVTKARQLFAATLDAPGGLQFQTIHSFCQSLLARFPLEAGVPVGFKVLDERKSQQLLATARRELMDQASAQPMGELMQAITHLLEQFGDDQFEKIEREIITQRRLLEPQLKHGSGFILSQLPSYLGLQKDQTEQSLLEHYCADDTHDYVKLREAAQALIGGKSVNDDELGQQLARWLEQDAAGRAKFANAFLSLFFTQKGTPVKNLTTTTYNKKHPDFAKLLQNLMESALRLRESLKACRTQVTSKAMIIFAADLLHRYQQHKLAQLALDYDDLIAQAAALITRERASWVLYKLDGGIEHVLVDEGQDTNPLQWQLLEHLTGNFFDSEPEPDKLPRSFFGVGDYKQSIYSFQGADPLAFNKAREDLALRLQQVDRQLERVKFQVSFRSTEAILSAVDKVFINTTAGADLPEYEPHISSLPGVPGLVEVWPPAPADEKEQAEINPLPERRSGRLHPRRKLASLIAAQIKHRVETNEILPSRGRPIRYGDVLVLVRTRGLFVPELVRACKQLRVPVSGADRMQLREQLAVEDMLALLQFLLLPEDSLTLATILKGPLIGLSEDELFELAYDRGKKVPLWRQLQKSEKHPAIEQWLGSLLNHADRQTPYALLAQLLAQACPADTRSGRHGLLTRLGPEAADPLDELLSAALEYEQQEAPSLQGFLRWMMASDMEIKRELEQAGGVVRIMTVHSAKGLEAPVVILADSQQPPTDKNLILLDPAQAAPPLLAPGKADEAEVMRGRRQALRRQSLQEYHRLLYVALTRAEDQLIIASWLKGNQQAPSENDNECWVNLVSQGLQHADNVEYDFTTLLPEGWKGNGLCYRIDGKNLRSEKEESRAATTAGITLPLWALREPAPEPSPTLPLTPSRAEDEPGVASPLAGEETARFRRGLIIHRLLQTLPDLPEDQRRTAGLRWTPPELHTVVDEVLKVLTDPASAFLFAPGSKAEVPVSGIVGNRVLSGQIDRLAVTGDTVWIADYKTNRTRPDKAEEVDIAYLRQLAAYRAALTPIYPDKRIRALLVWTNTPEIMPIPDELLDAHRP